MMDKTDRIYKVIRHDLDATQSMILARLLEPMIKDDLLVDIEKCIADVRVKVISPARVAQPMDIEATYIAEKLCEYILELRSYEKTNPDKYANSIRLLHRDNIAFTYALIEGVMDWLFQVYEPSDSFDWRDQIRSGIKFRKHFTRLLEQAKKEYGNSVIQEI